MSHEQGLEGGAIAYIGLGANLGDRLATLNQALERMSAFGRIQSVSSVYETDPVGFTDQPSFLNAVVGLETCVAPADLMARLLDIERDLHRVRTFPNAPRTIDLDLLLYEDEVIDTAGVTLPHPRLHERSFVLVPLAEIAPSALHPTLRVPVSELLGRLEPIEGVQQFPGTLERDPADMQ